MVILKTDAMQWYEGMLLQPQHFQQNDLRLRELLTFHLSEISPFHWGLKHFKIDSAQLVSGKLVFLELEAVMPDGLVVSQYVEEGELIEVDLSPFEAVLMERPVMTYLAVPQYVYGAANATGKMPRWTTQAGKEVVDENTGEGKIAIATIVPNTTIFVDELPSSNFVYVPLLEIRLEDNTHKLTSFYPPMLRVTRDSTLGEESHALVELIRAKIAYLVDKIGSNTKFEATKILEDTVHLLTMGLLPFEALLNAQASHPFTIYVALCALAGHVAGLHKQQVPPVFPAYNHNNIQRSFAQVSQFITGMLDRVQESYYTVKLSRQESTFTINLDEECLTAPYLLFGARVPVGTNAAEIAVWVEDAIISTASALDAAADNRVLGARRELVDAEQGLNVASSKSVLLFRVYQDKRFTVGGELLSIFNNLQRVAAPPPEIVLYIPK